MILEKKFGFFWIFFRILEYWKILENFGIFTIFKRGWQHMKEVLIPRILKAQGLFK
jgi:hypothetical protein